MKSGLNIVSEDTGYGKKLQLVNMVSQV